VTALDTRIEVALLAVVESLLEELLEDPAPALTAPGPLTTVPLVVAAGADADEAVDVDVVVELLIARAL